VVKKRAGDQNDDPGQDQGVEHISRDAQKGQGKPQNSNGEKNTQG